MSYADKYKVTTLDNAQLMLWLYHRDDIKQGSRNKLLDRLKVIFGKYFLGNK